jgi:Aconitase X
MRLTEEEQALRGGEFGPAAQWAIEHQIKVGTYLGAADFVPVTQAHKCQSAVRAGWPGERRQYRPRRAISAPCRSLSSRVSPAQ